MSDNPYNAPDSQIVSANHLARWLRRRKMWAWIAITALITGNISALVLKTRVEIVKSMDPEKLSEIILPEILLPGIVSILSVITILISLFGLLIAIRRVNKLRNSPSL